jgi:hypothetical protein
MNHAEAIFQAIPSQIKNQFKESFLVLVSQTVESSYSALPEQEKVNLFSELGKAGESKDFTAIYQAFAKIASEL